MQWWTLFGKLTHARLSRNTDHKPCVDTVAQNTHPDNVQLTESLVITVAS